MKIVHYIPTYAPAWQWGGPVRSVSDLCEGLAARGHDVTVLTTDAGLDLEAIPARGVEVRRNGVRAWYFPRLPGLGIRSPALERAVAEAAAGCDVLHATAVWQRTGPASAVAARRAGVPYVVSPRGALSPYSWSQGTVKKALYYLLRERRTLRQAAGFHYTSRLEAGECERFRWGGPSCIVANGIDPAAWWSDEPAGRAWREANGIGPRTRVFLYAGRIHDKKGLGLLPEALARGGGSDWRMVFVGPDGDSGTAALRAGFGRLSLGSRVQFLAAVPPERLRAAYSGADALLLPSLHENFGNVALEAAACGCRVIASDSVGVAMELAELGAAVVVPRRTDAWASAISAVAGRTSPGTAGLVRTAFSRTRTAAQMEQFYGEVVST